MSPEQRLRLATNSYIAEQWDHHLGFEPVELEGHNITIREAAQQRFTDGVVTVPENARIILSE